MNGANLMKVPAVLVNRSERRGVLRTLGVGVPTALIAGWFPKPSANCQTVNLAGAQSKFLSVNGVKLHYLEWGARDASPLLLLHPAPLNSYVWEAFASAVARNYRVVAPDARGFGESEWSDSYSDDIFIEDLHAFISVLG